MGQGAGGRCITGPPLRAKEPNPRGWVARTDEPRLSAHADHRAPWETRLRPSRWPTLRPPGSGGLQAGELVEDGPLLPAGGRTGWGGCSVSRVALRLYTVREERDMMPVAMTQESSLERSPLGDLYVRHAPEGIRLAFLLTGDRALAEDLVQEAFARLVGRLRHLRDPGAFTAYLRRTIVNLATSHFRRRRVERAYLERRARDPEPGMNPNEDLDQTMHEALLRLPKRQRAAIVLRFYEDLSDVQTAEVLRCSRGTVRSLVSRGMTTLRSELEGVSR
jgi:RNA polymerase sigma-70 factor (sigma-E family)